MSSSNPVASKPSVETKMSPTSLQVVQGMQGDFSNPVASESNSKTKVSPASLQVVQELQSVQVDTAQEELRIWSTEESVRARREMKSCSKRSKRDWSELPKEWLEKIATHLESCSDFCRFRAVCKKCYSAFPMKQNVELLLSSYFAVKIPSLPAYDDGFGQPMFLVTSELYLLQPLDQTAYPKSFLVTTEELPSGKRRMRLPLTKNPLKDLPSSFPTIWNLLDFRVTLIGEGFKLCFSNGSEQVIRSNRLSPWASYPTKSKVVFFHRKNLFESILMVLLLDQGGELGTLMISNKKWRYLDDEPGCCFDDIVKFKMLMYAIDRKGRAYLINPYKPKVLCVMSEPICSGCASDRRKLLVESSGELYMINRLNDKFRVYKLNEKKRKWDEVKSLGDSVLLVTFDNCYFVDANKLPGCRGNCILFPKNCFPDYSGGYYPDDKLFEGSSKCLEVGVYYLNEDRCQLITSYPVLSDLFWPLPCWIRDPRSFPSPSLLKEYEESASLPASEESQEVSSKSETSPNSVQDVQAVQEDIALEEVLIGNNDVPVEKFLGVNVSSHLVPILQKIWEKHGNILEGHVVSSNGLLKWALESLAKMIIILQTNSQSFVSDSQAEYLNTTLLDLQMMHFKIDWLVPFVKRALAINQFSEQKRAMEDLEIERDKLRAELHVVEVRINVQRKLVAKSLVSSYSTVDAKDMFN